MSILIYIVLVIVVVILFGEWILPIRIRNKIKSFFLSTGEKFITYETKLYVNQDTLAIEREIKEHKWIRIRSFISRILISTIAIIFFIIEELFWELTFKKLFAWIEIFSFIQKIKLKIKSLNKYWILTLFIIPFILMEILGVLALMAFSISILLGISTYVFKLLLFIPVKFIFNIGEDKLMSIPWFKIRYEILTTTLTWVKSTQSYIKIFNMFMQIKNIFSNWFKSDTSFVREVKVYFLALKKWLESFSKIVSEVEQNELKKVNEENTKDK